MMDNAVARWLPPPLGSYYERLMLNENTTKSMHFGGGKPPPYGVSPFSIHQ